MRRALLLAVTALAFTAQAQVFNIAAGDSSLLNASGAVVTMYLPNSTTQLSAGVAAGHIVTGFGSRFLYRGFDINAGDRFLAFALPTDFNSAGYGFAGRGLSLSRNNSKTDLLVFAGATAQSFSLPYLSTAKAADPTALVFYRRKLSPSLTFDSQEVFAARQTAIQSVTYRQRPFRLAVSGGLGNNAPYAGALFEIDAPWIQARASYAAAGRNFRRIAVPNMLATENAGANAQLDLRPARWAHLSAAHQTYTADNRRAAVNTVGAGIQAGAFDFYASQFIARNATGQSAGAGLRIGDRWAIHADAFRSRAGQTLQGSVSERLSRRVRFTQFLTRSAGRYSVSFGGDFTSNRLTVSAGYQMMFMPFLPGAPFQRVLTAQVSFQLPHSSTATVATTALPDGKLRYSVYGSKYLYGNWAQESGPGNHGSIGGKYVIRGTVVDKTGTPVEGAAIALGREVVFTDSQGQFTARVRKARPLPLRVAPEEFAAAGHWSVVSAPETAAPGSEIQIVVTQGTKPE